MSTWGIFGHSAPELLSTRKLRHLLRMLLILATVLSGGCAQAAHNDPHESANTSKVLRAEQAVPEVSSHERRA